MRIKLKTSVLQVSLKEFKKKEGKHGLTNVFFSQKVDYGVSDFCDPTCTSPADVVMKDMNLKRTNWSNTSVTSCCFY